MKDENCERFCQTINYGDEKNNKINVCQDNKYNQENNNYNNFKNININITKKSLDETFSITHRVKEANSQNFLVDHKKSYNDINNYNNNQLKKDCISVDELRINLNNAKEYIDDILNNNLIEEEQYKKNINPNYLDYQNEITPYMRSILIDWLIEINVNFNFKEATLYIAIYIIDAYLSKQQISKNYFQLLGVTSLFIASKLNEIKLRRISDYSDITNNTYNTHEIKAMEIEILKSLNFDLLISSPLSFYEIITQKIGIANDLNIFRFGEFLMQGFLINNQSLKYTPSIIALSVCYIIMKFCKIQNYKIIFENNFFNLNKNKCNGSNVYNKEHNIKECAQKICETINEIIKSKLKSIINKYSDNIYYKDLIKNM